MQNLTKKEIQELGAGTFWTWVGDNNYGTPPLLYEIVDFTDRCVRCKRVGESYIHEYSYGDFGHYLRNVTNEQRSLAQLCAILGRVSMQGLRDELIEKLVRLEI